MTFVLMGESSEAKVVIPAHKVIVASRCTWARMALQSGMKESLEKYNYMYMYMYNTVRSIDYM